jgi:hypothetical protein
MQEEAQDARSAREAELVEVLSSYVEPRVVSYRFVVSFVVLGLLGCVSVAWAASQAQIHVPIRFEPGAQQNLEAGIKAFERGDWDESERLLLAARQSGQVAPQRLEDYLERLALVRRDSERLLRAEEALEVGEPERALALTALVASNSAFFAQAEVLSRAARARAEEIAAKKLANQMDAEAAHQASRAAVVRTYVPESPVEASHVKTPRRGARPPAVRGIDRNTDADW